MQRHIVQRWLALPLLCAGLAALAACARSAATEPAPPADSTVVLAVGQSVALTPTATLRLDRVNDSRCKVGAVCVWAGYISYSFTVSEGGAATAFTLSDSMPGGAPSSSVQGRTFTLVGVEPAAPPALRAPEPDYRVSVKVSAN
ncbi:hypothetical protein [Janthinobacterium fluminis]|uniref:Lipoprotein n=1 Tax=Janthinobacterium fluminis TaxID=2987524 RepID=A0ABT5K590_9BURK|nr:hypothetical protein [Janthinobacterium fluminis]MDC8759810.1 hypothetical protein [Janthinobacterium fluminis]